jgi:hypothetical protein
VGRLDDIIERNKNPKTSFRKPKPSSGSVASAEPPAEPEVPREPSDEAPGSRLDRIVERNKNPKTSFRKAKPVPAPKAETQEVNQAEQGEQKGRLDRIIARNQNPNGGYRWLKVGLAGVVLFVVLILLIFTDLASPPEAAYPEKPAATKPTGVDGVKLWRAPKKKTSGSGAPRPGS